MYLLLRASLITVTVFTLRALALPSATSWQDAGTVRTIQLDASSVERLRREADSACPFNELLTGLRYTKNMLHSCNTPTLYPDIAAVPEVRNEVFLQLVSTIDKVLRLYDFYDTYLTSDCAGTTASAGGEEEASSECVEMRALTVVIDTLTNQTCDWIRSLGISYNSSDEEFVCTRSQLTKLHALTSAHILIREMFSEARMLRNTFSTTCDDGNAGVNDPTANWLRSTGLNTSLRTILAGTDYEVPHLNNVLNSADHPNCI